MAAKKVKKKATKKLMSDLERQKLLKPRGEYDKLVEKIAVELQRKTVRVDGLTAKKLTRLLSVAEKARQRENEVRAKQEAALRAVVDARMMAEHVLWDAVLETNATVKLASRRHPEAAERFSFLTDAMRGERVAPTSPSPE